MEKRESVVLAVQDIKTYFNTDDGIVKAVDGVSFTLHKGETLGIVGESGCGKSVSCLSLLQLIPSPPGKIISGNVMFSGKNILALQKKEIRKIRGGKIAMIFQDPMTSLNPFLRISTQMTETIRLHQSVNKKQSMEKAIEMLCMVGIPNPGKRIHSYPHQFSGGMRQRVMIAMALSCHPEVLIADEPTTALDVTIQAQILDIIKGLTVKTKTAVILITHDLGVVAGLCNTIAVMYAGKIIEKAPADDLFKTPFHPYTRGLINSVPRIDKPSRERLFSIDGQPPNLINIKDVCSFFPRCKHAMEICKKKFPPEIHKDGRTVCCYLYQKETPHG